jgi:hypothetical protein
LIKVQCPENEMTGEREATVWAHCTKEGLIQGLQGWFQDPYGPSIKAKLLYCLADDE